MSATQHAPEDLDQHFAMVSTPLPTIEYRLSAEAAKLMVQTLNSDMVGRYVRKLADGNDVDSLAQIVAAHRNTPKANLEQRIEIRFCVSHMLVDGGCNADFAKEWIEVFDSGDREEEIEYLQSLFGRPSQSILDDQRRLGMVAMNPFFLRHSNNRTTLLEQTMECKTSTESEILPDYVRALGLILKRFHPDQPPEIHQVNDDHQLALVPLTDMLLCRGKAKFMYLLSAVEEAYGLQNQMVRPIVQQSLHRMIDDGHLVTLAFAHGACQWGAMERWGGAGLVEKIPGAKHPSGKSIYHLLCMQSPEVFAQRVSQIQRMGGDIDEPVRMGLNTLRLIEQSVMNCNADNLGFLMGIGANPDLPMIDNPAETAVTIGLKMDLIDSSKKDTQALEKMCSLLRSHQAKTAALSAIESIGAEMGLKRSPGC